MSAEVTLSGWYRHVAGDPMAVMGWTKSALEAAPALDIGDPEDVGVAVEAYMAALDGANKLRFLGRVVGQDGISRWVEADVQRQRDSRATDPPFVAVFRPGEPPSDGKARFHWLQS